MAAPPRRSSRARPSFGPARAQRFLDGAVSAAPGQKPYGFTPSFASDRDPLPRARALESVEGRLRDLGPAACQAFVDLRVLEPEVKDSSSHSVVGFCVDLDSGLPMAVKAFPWLRSDALVAMAHEQGDEPRSGEAGPTSVLGLQYEACAYGEAAERLGTPNIVQALGTLTVAWDDPAMGMPFLRTLAEQAVLQLGTVSPLLHAAVGLELVFTERRLGALPFHDAVRGASLEAVRALVFQTVYTLYAMQQAQVQHHDLHLRNMLVDIDPDEERVEYRAAGLTFDVPLVDGKVMVFDWDRGYTPACGPNLRLDLADCRQTSACSQVTSKYDWVMLLHKLSIAETWGDGDMRAFAHDMLGLNAIQEMRDGLGFPCNEAVAASDRCAPWPPTGTGWLDEVADIADAFEHDYFQPLRALQAYEEAAWEAAPMSWDAPLDAEAAWY